jgi:hypothetical protein
LDNLAFDFLEADEASHLELLFEERGRFSRWLKVCIKIRPHVQMGSLWLSSKNVGMWLKLTSWEYFHIFMIAVSSRKALMPAL